MPWTVQADGAEIRSPPKTGGIRNVIELCQFGGVNRSTFADRAQIQKRVTNQNPIQAGIAEIGVFVLNAGLG